MTATRSMSVSYKQTSIYASKKARLARSLRQANNSSILVVCISHDDVMPDFMRGANNKDDFPLVGTSSNLKSLPAVAAKERVSAGMDLGRIERGKQKTW